MVVGRPQVVILGAGQIGTFAARALAERADVVAVDQDPMPGYFSRFGPREPCPLEEVNVLDRQALRRLFHKRRCDAVLITVGLAGATSVEDPKRAWSVNVEAPQMIGEEVRRAGIPLLVFVSSLAVYGRPSRAAITEDCPLAPTSEYGRTKAAAERALFALCDRSLAVRVVRTCGIYGPLRLRQGSHSARLIESLVFAGARKRTVELSAGLRTSDEYLYVKDLGDALSRVTLDDPGAHAIFNVGTGVKTTARGLVVALKKLGLAITLKVAPADGLAPMPPLDVSLIRRVLGFSARYRLAEGLRDYMVEAGLW